LKKETWMKTVKFALMVMAVLLLPAYSHALDLGSVRISFLEGDVQMRTSEAGEWVPAAVNTPLDEGDELWVPEGGRMEFQLNTGTAVRLDENSALQILTLERTSSQFYLTEGHAYVNHNSPRGNVIQFDTPVASLRSYERSVFRVDVPDQFTDLSVFTGSVDAEGRDGKTRSTRAGP
jgi:ferric-dicitrate binding protein FerR (iron transport regulator)